MRYHRPRCKRLVALSRRGLYLPLRNSSVENTCWRELMCENFNRGLMMNEYFKRFPQCVITGRDANALSLLVVEECLWRCATLLWKTHVARELMCENFDRGWLMNECFKRFPQCVITGRDANALSLLVVEECLCRCATLLWKTHVARELMCENFHRIP